MTEHGSGEKPDPLYKWGNHRPSADEIEAHYPDSQHQPDECEMCRFIHDAAKAYVAPALATGATPRTDAAALAVKNLGHDKYDLMVRHARQLERELAEEKRRHEATDDRWMKQAAEYERMLKASPSATLAKVPEGEARWLIEGKKYYPTRTVFWTGAWWTEDALQAARFPSKEAAEGERLRKPLEDAHFIESVEHMFQCGQSAVAEGGKP